jgi:hypothetical protein
MACYRDSFTFYLEVCINPVSNPAYSHNLKSWQYVAPNTGLSLSELHSLKAPKPLLLTVLG